MSWHPTNPTSFIVKDCDIFSATVLPLIFGHSNYPSFIRQLNKYGFSKAKSSKTCYNSSSPQTSTARDNVGARGGCAGVPYEPQVCFINFAFIRNLANDFADSRIPPSVVCPRPGRSRQLHLTKTGCSFFVFVFVVLRVLIHVVKEATTFSSSVRHV